MGLLTPARAPEAHRAPSKHSDPASHASVREGLTAKRAASIAQQRASKLFSGRGDDLVDPPCGRRA
jgi:hypothetical protein